jgi:pimeloyl-ACP methyl ester carboxylesterase
MILAQLTVVVSSVLGWSDTISVQPSHPDRIHSSFQRSLAGLDKPSERTLETLKRYDVERRYKKDVDGALATLEKIVKGNPDPELVYALAELSWVEGRRLDRWRRPAAIDRYLDAVAYAYDFLFDPELAAGRQPSDPRFRLACELYNGGLDRLIRAAQSNGQIMPEGTIKLKVHGKEQVLKVALEKSPWKPDDVAQVILASDFEVSGLNTRSYQYGLGVPLIGIHRPEHAGEGVERFYPPEMAFPLTAFLVPNSRLRDPANNAAEPRQCTLQLVDPVEIRQVGSKAAQMQVEADLTTPLAYMWSGTDLNRYRWVGLVRPGAAMKRANLMLLRPYEPGKIPVVMVHGLISSPLTWIPMINELLNDPEIRSRYQFLLYMYPTGVSIPIAAAGLRESLVRAQQMYDPRGNDPAFNQMVLLGHSMGGLLSHAMSVDSGDRFWQLYTARRFDQIIGPPEVLSQIQRYLYFEHLPFVRRVVFLATPHRGSDFSRNMIGRVGTSFISEPDEISSMLAKLLKNNPDAFDRRQFRRMPTSIETLDTDSPVLLALLAMQPGKDVAFHSIIGYYTPGPVASTTDTVVPYRSSHLDGIESELRVPSDHGVHKAPEALQEVRRILRKQVGIEPAPLSSQPPQTAPAVGVPVEGVVATPAQAAAPAPPRNRR